MAEQKTSGCAKIVALFAVVIGGVWILSAINSSPSPTGKQVREEPKGKPIDKSTAAQAKREKMLKGLGAGGLIGKVECRQSGAEVWVNPMFDAITYDQKTGLAVTVYEFCYDRTELGQFVKISSNQTHKELGMFTAESGLDLE